MAMAPCGLVGRLPISIHSTKTQKNNIILTARRTSNFTDISIVAAGCQFAVLNHAVSSVSILCLHCDHIILTFYVVNVFNNIQGKHL
jgi:hypothetical protein